LRHQEYEIVGIVPMAGKGSRLGKLPFSKELYPVDYENGKLKVVANHLMDSMVDAGVSQIHIVIRDGKWDIPAYYKSTFSNKTPICYHITEYEYGVPFSVNQANAFLNDKHVVLGFPDILFKPKNACKNIVDQLLSSDVSIVLGLFPVSNPTKYDMVLIDDNDLVQDIVIKPTETTYKYGWILAAWKSPFNHYLNQFIQSSLSSKTSDELINSEIFFGDVIIAAIESGLQVKGVVFDKGKSVDLGTPENLRGSSFFGV